MKARALRGFAALIVTGFLHGCGGTATAPDPLPSVNIATGPQILRITSSSRCAEPGSGAPFVQTRIVVNRVGAEWIGTADSTAAGDVTLRIRQGSWAMPGSMAVTGTITGTAVHMPELIPTLPAWTLSAHFGTNGQTVLDGVAYEAGALPSTSGGLDGTGVGPFTLVNAAGVSCSSSQFSWAVFPQPTH